MASIRTGEERRLRPVRAGPWSPDRSFEPAMRHAYWSGSYHLRILRFGRAGSQQASSSRPTSVFGEEAFRDNVPRLSYISPQGRLLEEVDDEGQQTNDRDPHGRTGSRPATQREGSATRSGEARTER